MLDAAVRTGCEAVHPGYGFLAEDAAFARACAAAGVTFIGPPAAAIEAMGSKISARRLAQAAGVPVVPGDVPEEQTDDAVAAAIDRIGRPALVKAAAGGGGIGMRLAGPGEDVRPAIRAARRDALHAFGDGTLYVERLLDRPRHVEIQIIADGSGRVVPLFERECSLQRRHQKVIEESPSPILTPALRAQMSAAAVAVAEAVGYRNAGTVEFLVEEREDGDPRFYFLEMNTRLQVEHPVTEAITGLDLVRAQLLVAAGEPLPFSADTLALRGHAIELRVYAEDPATGFLPQAGPLLVYREPGGPGVRVDSGVAEGDAVSVHYDPLLAKLIVHAESRPAALARAARALSEFAILGIATNLPLLRAMVGHPLVRDGRLDTGFLERELPALLAAAETPDLDPAVAAVAVHRLISGGGAAATGARTIPDPWTTLSGWRIGGNDRPQSGESAPPGVQT
ncbi:MAG TPA: biotin carboxylase N-terminal domain-containing protein, partial [Vicinamibacterales bacterium]